MDCHLPSSSVHAFSRGKNTGSGLPIPFPRVSSWPRDQTGFLHCQVILLSRPTREARSFITSLLFHLLTQVPSLFLNLDISWHYPSPVPRGFLPQLSGLKKFVCKSVSLHKEFSSQILGKHVFFFSPIYVCIGLDIVLAKRGLIK